MGEQFDMSSDRDIDRICQDFEPLLWARGQVYANDGDGPLITSRQWHYIEFTSQDTHYTGCRKAVRPPCLIESTATLPDRPNLCGWCRHVALNALDHAV